MNLNKCFIGGNLTRDPELKHLQSGQSVCNFSIASNRTWLDKDKNKQEEATFFDCVAWGKTGENIAKFFAKGRPIFIEARAQNESWDDKETGKKMSKMKFVAESFQFVGGDKKDDKPAGEIEVKPSVVGKGRKPVAEPPAMNPDDIPF